MHNGLGEGEGSENRGECAYKALYSIKKGEIVDVLPCIIISASNISLILEAVAAIL